MKSTHITCQNTIGIIDNIGFVMYLKVQHGFIYVDVM